MLLTHNFYDSAIIKDSTDINNFKDINNSTDINDPTDTGNMEINKDFIDVMDTNNFKDALLASLYSQVEYLRDELHETNTHIRTLLSIIKDRKPLYEENKSFSLIQQLQEIRAVKHLEYNDKLANRELKT